MPILLGRDISRASYLIALLLGVILVADLFPLDIFTHATLPDYRYNGDLADHVAGQRAFIEDAWHWPLLRTTLLDWPTGLNIAMTDGNPFVALPLKFFHKLLPPAFSAVQWWLALAYVLQPVAAVFALRSAGETRLLPAVAAAIFALSTPTFLNRHPHSALSSHFILLIALGAYFRTIRGLRGRRLLTPLLLPASLLIHPYLAFMTFALLLAAPVTLACRLDRRCIAAGITFAAALLLTVLMADVLGYQAAPPAIGFGYTSMNLLAPLYPNGSYFFGAHLKYLDATGTQYEGYQYLGFGLLILLPCALLLCVRSGRGMLRRHPGLILASLALTALAASDVMYFGYHRILDLGQAPAIFEQLRASGRLFWPVTYIMMIGAIVAVARLAPAPVAAALLLATAGLQCADAHHLRWIIHRDLRATAVLPIDAGRLDQLFNASTLLTILPTFGCGADSNAPEFMQLLLASTRHVVAANTMYVARFPRTPSCDDTETAQIPLANGELRVFLPNEAFAGPLSVPDGQNVCRALSTVAICTRRRDLLGGLRQVAPPLLALNQTYSTAAGGATAMLGPGWYGAEPGGVWSLDQQAVLAFRTPVAMPGLVLEVVASGYTGVMGRPQHVAVFANGRPMAAWTIPNQVPAMLRTALPAAVLGAAGTVITLQIATPTRPSDHGIRSDSRQLGLFLTSVRLIPAGG